MKRRAYCEESQKRLLRITISSLPAFSAAAFMASAFAASMASGFSHSTCLPARKAAIATSEWRSLGVQMSTASISGLASSSR